MSRTKRVLVVASTFPASDTDSVPAFVRDQIIALKKSYPSVQFFVLAPHDFRSNTKSYTRHRNYDEYRFHYVWPRRLEGLAGRGIVPALQSNRLNYLLVPFFLISEYAHIKRLVKKLRPDVVYAHWFMPNAVTAAPICDKFSVPLVFTSHSSDIQIMNKLPFGKKVTYYVLARTRRWTVVSKRTAEKARQVIGSIGWQIHSKSMGMIPMGIDVVAPVDKASIDNANYLDNLDLSEKFSLFIGRLAEVKGVEYLIDAFGSINEKNTKLVIAGTGPMETKLRQMATKFNLHSRIIFVGFVTGKLKQRLLNGASVLVIPSTVDSHGQSEGFPVVLMEGIANHKIIVASDVSGAELVLNDGVNGFLFRNADAGNLSEKLNMALGLSEKSKNEFRSELSKLNKDFSWKNIARQHYDFLFKDLLAKD